MFGDTPHTLFKQRPSMVTGFGLRRVHFRIESMVSIGKVALIMNLKVCRLGNGSF